MSQFFFAELAIEQVPSSPRGWGIKRVARIARDFFSLCNRSKRAKMIFFLDIMYGSRKFPGLSKFR
jgi:hypothetical protein